MPRKLTTREYISKCVAKHGDKYDYSVAEYIGNDKPISIVCKTHGVFTPRANDHLSKSAGCPSCAGVKRLTTSEFIERASKVHDNKYTYGNVVYAGNDVRVSITCPEHGDFLQTPHDHLANHGCPKCVGLHIRTTEEFVTEAKAVHGDSYDYAKTVYTRSKNKVIIGCKVHGDFEQSPSQHKSGAGCPTCGGRDFVGRKFYDTRIFVEASSAAHQNKYGYANSNYANKKTPVYIECPTHGNFKQLPLNHMHGHGCPKCAEYGFNINSSASLYILTTSDFIGFGITNKLKTRLVAHKTALRKRALQVLSVVSFDMAGEQALELERNIKLTFKDSIINTGIVGFKTEALPLGLYDNLKTFCDKHVLTKI